MGVLDVLGRAATVAGKGFEGYAVDSGNRVKQSLAQANLKRQTERDAVLELVARAGIDPTIQGNLEGARAGARVQPAVDQATALAPVAVKQATDIATATAPIAQATHKANRQTDVANPLPVTETFTPVTLGGEGGAPPVVKPMSTRTGKTLDAIGDAKPVSGTSGLGSAALKGKIADNKTQIAAIDATLKELDAHPDAVGMKRGVGMIPGMSRIGEIINQKADSAGVGTRNKLQQVGSIVIHNQSGTAVSGSEFQRLGFVPDPAYDYSANRKKLLDLRTWAEEQTRNLEEQMGRVPKAPTTGSAPTASSGDPEFDALMAKHRKKP